MTPAATAITVALASAAAVAVVGTLVSLATRRPYEVAPGCVFIVHDEAASIALARRLGEEGRDPDVWEEMRRTLAPGCELELWTARPEDVRFRFALVRGYLGGALAGGRITLAEVLAHLHNARKDVEDSLGIGLPEGV